MKTFGLSILGGIVGYVVGLLGGIALVSMVSSNTHDKSMEVVMTDFTATVVKVRDGDSLVVLRNRRAIASLVTVMTPNLGSSADNRLGDMVGRAGGECYFVCLGAD